MRGSTSREGPSTTPGEEATPTVLHGPVAPIGPPLFDRLVAAASRDRAAKAVIAPDGELTYGQMLDAIQALTTAIKAMTTPGEPVLVEADRSRYNAASMVAVLMSGRTYVPFDAGRFGRDSIGSIAAAVGARHLVKSEEQQIETVAATAGVDNAPSLRTHPAYVLFTSGSTGRPKPVWVGHETLDNLIDWQARRSHAGPGWRTLQFAAATFDVSLQEVLSTLATGGTLIVPSKEARKDPDELLDVMRREQVDRIFVPYVVLEQLARAAEHNQPLGLREVITAGEALHVTPSIRRWLAREHGATLDNQYGPTETHVLTANRMTGDPTEWPGTPSIGTPIQGASLVLLDGDTRPIPLDDHTTSGEIRAHGVPVGLGYGGGVTGGFATSSQEEPQGASYLTGDMARWGADGTLVYEGRNDDQVKVSGVRLQLSEVEAVLRGLEEVREAAVTVVGSGTSRRLAAFVVPASGTSTARVRERMAQSAAPHLVPSIVSEIERLPLTPHGKVDRRALTDWLDSTTDAARSALADPKSPLDAAWAQSIGQPPSSADQDFFEAGGDSLAAVRFLAAVREATGHRLSLRDFAASPTMRWVRDALPKQQRGAAGGKS